MVRYRLGWRQLPWLPLAVCAMSFVLNLGQNGRSWSDKVPYLAVTLAVDAVLLAWIRTSWGTDLRPDALVSRGRWRRRVVPWRDVTQIDVRRRPLGVTQVRVVTRDDAFTLIAPVRTAFLAPDPGFDAKAEELVRFWVERRGPEWTPSRVPTTALAT